MQGSIRKAEQLTIQLPNAFIPMQFDNNATPDAHRQTTAKEIIEAMDELGKPLSAFIATSGTGGTITGTGEALKEHYKNLKVHVVEPAGSPVLSGGK